MVAATGYPSNLVQDINDSKLVRTNALHVPTMRQQRRNQISRKGERAGCIAVRLGSLRQESGDVIFGQWTVPLLLLTRLLSGPVPTTQIAPLLNAANITQLFVFGLR